MRASRTALRIRSRVSSTLRSFTRTLVVSGNMTTCASFTSKSTARISAVRDGAASAAFNSSANKASKAARLIQEDGGAANWLFARMLLNGLDYRLNRGGLGQTGEIADDAFVFFDLLFAH